MVQAYTNLTCIMPPAGTTVWGHLRLQSRGPAGPCSFTPQLWKPKGRGPLLRRCTWPMTRLCAGTARALALLMAMLLKPEQLGPPQFVLRRGRAAWQPARMGGGWLRGRLAGTHTGSICGILPVSDPWCSWFVLHCMW
jgi:hypothetical protein